MNDYLLSGLRVIDCATVIAAPAAAMMLADYGADVIKIEAPGEGDMLRMLSHLPTSPNTGEDWFWQLDGRNKRGLTLDLTHADGQAVLRRLIAGADVFITNLPFPVRDHLGVSFEAVRALNQRLIYASLTAYGETGPERERKGFDQLAYWARSGLMDLMRAPDTTPTQGLPGMGDHPTAVALFASIMTALLHRERTGEGGMAHTSLLANGLWSAAGVAQGAIAGGDTAAYRERMRVYPAMMRPYAAADGRWLQFNMVRTDALLDLLLTALDAADLLTDPRFGDPETLWENRAAFGDAIAARVAQADSDHWLRVFAELGVPVNRVAVIEEAATDEQLLANEIVAPPEDPQMQLPLLIDHPVRITSVPRVGPRRAPGMGEHATDILAELGYDPAEIQQLRDDGVLG
ncbi:MAG: CoA transferase [Pseudomonadota bacterium]